jgi:small-conductance mechanosensitive channel
LPSWPVAAAADCRSDSLASGWLKKYQAKLASEVGQLRNDSQLHTPKAI